MKQFSRFSNFGDELARLLVNHFWPGEIRIIGKESVGRRNLVVVGSIVDWSDPWSIVCGAGAISDRALPICARQVLGVRGPLTNKVLAASGLGSAAVLGDPGYLVPRLMGTDGPVRHAVGFVPHYVDRNPELDAAAAAAGMTLIDVLRPPLEVVAEIMSCERIVSSSLHGLVIGDAAGKPTTWIKLGDRLHGGDFKFHDYLLSHGMHESQIAPYVGALSGAADHAFIKPCGIDTVALEQMLGEAVHEATKDIGSGGLQK